jgi:hypothetical protein
MYTTIWTYVWDFLDDGVDEVLRFLKTEIGLDAISLATSYHTVEHLRPHTRGRRFFNSYEAAVYFKPDLSLYEETHLKPNVSPLASGAVNPLKLISNKCKEHELKLISWTVCLHNSHLGRKYPDCTERNAFGESYPPYLCPSNLAVRNYIKALLKDLSRNYDFMGLELESLSFGGFGHFHGHEKIGFELNNVTVFLLSLCFCQSCQQRAKDMNIDTNSLRQKVKKLLADVFSSGEPLKVKFEELLADKAPELQSYLEMRQDSISSLIREVKAEVETPIFAIDMGDPKVSGLNLKEISNVADRVEILCYSASEQAVSDSISKVKGTISTAENLTTGFSCYYPASPDQATLQRNVKKAFGLGATGFSFYNYGIMPKPNLTWVKEAIKSLKG